MKNSNRKETRAEGSAFENKHGNFSLEKNQNGSNLDQFSIVEQNSLSSKKRYNKKGNEIVNLAEDIYDQNDNQDKEINLDNEVVLENSVFEAEDSDPKPSGPLNFSPEHTNQQNMSYVNQSKETWIPYKFCNYEMPFFKATPLAYYKYRYSVLRIVHKSLFRILGVEITIGGLFLAAAFIVLGITGGYFSYNSSGDRYQNTGIIASISAIILFAFASRNSIFTFLTGVSYDRLVVWHKWLGIIVVGLSLSHGMLSFLNGRMEVTGVVLFALFAGMTVFSFLIKLYSYRLFLIFHRLMIIAIIVFVALHGANYIFIGIGLWGFDMLVRLIFYLLYRRNIKEATFKLKSTDIIEVSFPKKNFRYMGGQFAFLTVPRVSLWEPHPFSMSSSPNDSAVTFHIKAMGKWTEDLAKLASREGVKMSIFIDGPYGAPSIDIEGEAKKNFLLISGGIGITPMRSIANALLGQVLQGRQVNKIFFYWAVRDAKIIKSILCSKELLMTFNRTFRHSDGSKILDRHIFLTSMEQTNQTFTDLRQNASFVDSTKSQKLELEEIFLRAKNYLKTTENKHLSVLCCGPNLLIDQASKMAKENGFEFHGESFGL